MDKLLVATTNRGKIREYRSLLNGLPFQLVTPDELGINIEVEENRPSYEENASTKAKAYARAGRLITLADDSGLEVDVLGGEPGIRSARAAGEAATDKDRIEHLLARLEGVPLEKRTARFECVIAIAVTEEITELCHGECRGFIALEPGGKYGFGYDPVFYLPEFDKTMAELPLEIKNRISHRGQAAREAYRVLEKIAGEVKL
jgi:XTP/dITP diphosphohydrolase